MSTIHVEEIAACVQRNRDVITALELVLIFWLFADWHGEENCMPVAAGDAGAQDGVRSALKSHEDIALEQRHACLCVPILNYALGVSPEQVSQHGKGQKESHAGSLFFISRKLATRFVRACANVVIPTRTTVQKALKHVLVSGEVEHAGKI